MANGFLFTPQHASSTLVNISSDAELRLIRMLAPHSTNLSPQDFEAACSSHIANGDAAGLLQTVLSEPDAIAGLVYAECTVDEAMGAFSLLGALLDRVGDKHRAESFCRALADVVMATANLTNGHDIVVNGADKRSVMVAALFNLRSDGVEKVRLLTNVVDLADVSALAPGGPEGLSTLADMLDYSSLRASLALWGAEFDIPNVDKRALFRAIVKGMDRVLEKIVGGRGEGKVVASAEVEVARKIKAARDRKQIYLLQILETYSDQSQIDNEAIEYAQQASIGAINDPINHFSAQCHLLHLHAVKALKHSKSTESLYDLLSILYEGKLQDYHDFIAMPNNSSVFSTFHLNEDEFRKNMSLFNLVSLAGQHEEIPYSTIATTLDIDENQVEKWVILAVSSGLMEAKMDQLSKVVIVERCVLRQFGTKEWESLKVRLDKWKINVKGVLDALRKSSAGMITDGQ